MEVAHPPFRNVPNVDSKPNFLLLQNFISISHNFLIVKFFLYISIYKLKKQSINFTVMSMKLAQNEITKKQIYLVFGY